MPGLEIMWGYSVLFIRRYPELGMVDGCMYLVSNVPSSGSLFLVIQSEGGHGEGIRYEYRALWVTDRSIGS